MIRVWAELKIRLGHVPNLSQITNHTSHPVDG